MNSSETFNLNAQTSGKNVRQQNMFPMHIRRSFPSRSGAPSSWTHDWDILVQIQELHSKPQTQFRFCFNFPLR